MKKLMYTIRLVPLIFVILLSTTSGLWAQVSGKVKVAAIYTVPVEQQWVSRIHKALNAAKDRGEIEYSFSENVANTDYERVMREYSEQGNHLLVGEVFGVERAARKVAKDYPSTSYLMGSSFGPSGKNFSVFDNWIHEPSYLTGMIAGGMTKTNKIGVVGGYPIPEVNRLIHAFMDGAREINPNVQFMVSFIGSWFDPPKAKESAFAQIERGADIMYAERFGVSDAAMEKGILAIGNVIDTQSDYPKTVVASALWHMEPSINRAIGKVKSGSFEPEDYGPYSFMVHGGASLANYGTFESKISSSIKRKVAERQQEIRDGLFRVNVNDQEPKSTM